MLKKLLFEDWRIVGVDIKDVEFVWLFGMFLVKNFGEGFWKV